MVSRVILYTMSSIPHLKYHIDDKNLFETAKDIILHAKPNWERNDIKFKVNISSLCLTPV